MIFFNQTEKFKKWLSSLKDTRAKARIAVRLNAARLGNFGDCRCVGSSVWEMRIHFGPGYRIYYAQEGTLIYLLLAGGDKSSQTRDIALAIELWEAYRHEQNNEN